MNIIKTIKVAPTQLVRRIHFKFHSYSLRHKDIYKNIKIAVILLTVLLAYILASTQEYRTLEALSR